MSVLTSGTGGRLNLFVVGDNLRKGALNAVQIAEELLKRR